MVFTHMTKYNRYAYLTEQGIIKVVNSIYVKKDPSFFKRKGVVKTWRIYANTSACTVLTDEAVFTELFKLDKYQYLTDEFKQRALRAQ